MGRCHSCPLSLHDALPISRELQPGALTARQIICGAPGLVGAKQKVLKVADDMPALAADFDEIATLTDDIDQRGVGVKTIAQLIEIGDLQPLTAPNLALGGLQFPEYQLQQR